MRHQSRRAFLEGLAQDPAWIAVRRRGAPRLALALNVFRLRDAAGWSQAELAARAGVRQPRIAEIERGDANPRLETIVRLARALGAEASALIAPVPGVEGTSCLPHPAPPAGADAAPAA